MTEPKNLFREGRTESELRDYRAAVDYLVEQCEDDDIVVLVLQVDKLNDRTHEPDPLTKSRALTRFVGWSSANGSSMRFSESFDEASNAFPAHKLLQLSCAAVKEHIEERF